MPQLNDGQIAVIVVIIYMAALLLLGLASNFSLKRTTADYFVASHSIGPFLLLLTLFGTTMTAFAMIGSSAEAYKAGIGVYGLMVSWSGIFHSVCFFAIGIKLWAWGKRYGYVTQIQFFRDRFESDKIGLVLFPVLVGLVIPYLLVGIIGSGSAIQAITRHAFDKTFPGTDGGIPFAIGAAAVCFVVLVYVFFGGVRGTTWANAFQTAVFVVLGGLTFFVIADKLGGPVAATKNVIAYNPAHLKVADSAADHENFERQLARFEAKEIPIRPKEPEAIPPTVFFTYLFVPFSVAMFPHLFQHWLTARRAASFRLSVIVHPLLMLMVWLPCVLIGVWATSAVVNGQAVLPQVAGFDANKVLPVMVAKLSNAWLGGLLTAGLLAAIMSSLDSQFLSVSSIFSNDIVAHYIRHERMTDGMRVALGRLFVVLVVAVSYWIAISAPKTSVFALGVWCFTGFAGLAPLAFAAVFWKRATKWGAYACVLVAAGLTFYLFRDSGFGKDRDYAVLVAGYPVTAAAVVVVTSTVAMLLVSLLTPAPSAATIAKFYGKPADAA